MSSRPEPITSSDAADLVELFDSAGPYVAARTMSDYWLYARLFNNTCPCIRVDGRPVAALIGFRDQTEGVNEIYVQDVAVDPAHRKKGYASTLLDDLHQRAREWSTNRVWLTSEVENTGAMSLWRKQGYLNHKADYQQNGIWLTRDLKGPGRDRAVYELTLS